MPETHTNRVLSACTQWSLPRASMVRTDQWRPPSTVCNTALPETAQPTFAFAKLTESMPPARATGTRTHALPPLVVR